MVWCQKHRTNALLPQKPLECLNIETIFIERQRHESGRQRVSSCSIRRVAEAFDRYYVPRRDQRARATKSMPCSRLRVTITLCADAGSPRARDSRVANSVRRRMWPQGSP